MAGSMQFPKRRKKRKAARRSRTLADLTPAQRGVLRDLVGDIELRTGGWFSQWKRYADQASRAAVRELAKLGFLAPSQSGGYRLAPRTITLAREAGWINDRE